MKMEDIELYVSTLKQEEKNRLIQMVAGDQSIIMNLKLKSPMDILCEEDSSRAVFIHNVTIGT